MGRILPALGTNQIDQIAGFVEYHPLTNREKINTVISYTHLKDIPGLLLFIDFEKVFDTIVDFLAENAGAFWFWFLFN